MKNRLLIFIFILSTHGICAEAVDSIKRKKFEIQIGLVGFYNGFNKSGWASFVFPSTIVRASFTKSNNFRFGIESLLNTGIEEIFEPKFINRKFYKYEDKSQYFFTDPDKTRPLGNVKYYEMNWIGIYAGKEFVSKNWSLNTSVHLNQVIKWNSWVTQSSPFHVHTSSYDYIGTGAGVSYDLNYKLSKSLSVGWSSALYYFKLKAYPRPGASIHLYEEYTPKYLMLNNLYIGFRF